jgi:RNA polymerase-binding transcription factor DksA
MTKAEPKPKKASAKNAPAKQAAKQPASKSVKRAPAKAPRAKPTAPAKKTARVEPTKKVAKPPVAKLSVGKPPVKPAVKPVVKPIVQKAEPKKLAAKAAVAKPVAKPVVKPVLKPVAKKVEPKKLAPPVLVKKPPPRKSTVICPLSGFEVKPARPNLAPSTVERLRVKLLDERDRHLAQADQLAAEAQQLALDRDEGDTQFDEEGGEGDTISVERERDLMLSASAHQTVEEIDRALERIKNRTYGLCVPAGRRISVERLEALPYAETCVDCKARAERRR